MLPSLFRSIRTRSLLAVAMAVLVRCSPDAAPCVALPGSSIFLWPRAMEPQHHAPVAASTSSALQGRAAPAQLPELLAGRDAVTALMHRATFAPTPTSAS